MTMFTKSGNSGAQTLSKMTVSSSVPSSQSIKASIHNRQEHICDIYCTECEIAVKKSRTLLLSCGGDVIINSGYREELPEGSSESGDWLGENGNGRRTNCSVYLNVPSFDFRTHRLVINLSIESKRCTDDMNIIERNLSQLRESGWFFDNLTFQTAQNLLEKTEAGTFLLRNSSDPKFIFSLSVQTSRGPTSIRINFAHGKFHLDAENSFNGLVPKEDNVIKLLETHIKSSQRPGQVWVEPNGKYYSSVLLVKPLKKNVPTLQHLSRVVVNRHQLQSHVPPGIKGYLREYPHTI